MRILLTPKCLTTYWISFSILIWTNYTSKYELKNFFHIHRVVVTPSGRIVDRGELTHNVPKHIAIFVRQFKIFQPALLKPVIQEKVKDVKIKQAL